MARRLGGFLVFVIVISICKASALFNPISDVHRSAALELFTPVDGSFGSLQEAYEAVRTFEALKIQMKADTSTSVCRSITDTIGSPSSAPKELFYALKLNGILKCQIGESSLEGIVPGLKAGVNAASSLLDFYYSIGSLALVKDQASKANVHLEDASGIFRSIKALSQSNGRWRYSSNNPQSSTFAAGIALETLAGVVSLASSGVDQSLISALKSDIVKLFDTIEKYDDGAYYFDEKIDGSEDQGPLSTTSSVVRGITAFAAVTDGNLNLSGEQMMGLGKFFLGIATFGDAKDFFYQIDSLACLESNRVAVPLILSLPSTLLSFPKKDSLKVRVNTVLNSNAPPPLSVRLVKALPSGSKDKSVVESQELKFDTETGYHILDVFSTGLDVGCYVFAFEVALHESEHEKIYATERQTEVPVFITGIINVDGAEIAILDSDLDNIETQKKVDLSGKMTTSLAANHLQKFRLSFELTTPNGNLFRPHQALLKLRHATGVEHTFVVGNSGKRFLIVLDFLGLVEKFFYLSGKYDLELAVGDAVMENSFMHAIGHIKLDLPEPPEKAARPPAPPVDPYSRYGPKAEITHIFRAPEKLPPKNLSLAFLGLTFLPLVGFLVGLLRLGVNLKNFPTKPAPAAFAVLFHGGIAAVLLLYVLFWVKLDLFTTLKVLGLLGTFLLFVGHRTLSHLAAASAKLKSL